MSSGSPQQPEREVARAIVGGIVMRSTAVADTEPNTSAARMRMYTVVLSTIRAAMGDDGCNALLERALTSTRPVHPALTNIKQIGPDGIELAIEADKLDAAGLAALHDAIEAVLTALVEILVRLIGEDMTIRLLDVDGDTAPRGVLQ